MNNLYLNGWIIRDPKYKSLIILFLIISLYMLYKGGL